MPKRAGRSSATPQKKCPARTPESREKQLISLAVDLVEERLRDGTASSQETTHFLKLASSKHRYEVEKLRAENELLKAKTSAIRESKHIEDLYINAIKAMRAYGGTADEEDVY